MVTWPRQIRQHKCMTESIVRGLQGIKLLGDCEFVAIFDADFKPEPDFLLRTVPYLIGNSEIGYVQTRWTFTNPEESYLTKVHYFDAPTAGHISRPGGLPAPAGVDAMSSVECKAVRTRQAARHQHSWLTTTAL